MGAPLRLSKREESSVPEAKKGIVDRRHRLLKKVPLQHQALLQAAPLLPERSPQGDRDVFVVQQEWHPQEAVDLADIVQGSRRPLAR